MEDTLLAFSHMTGIYDFMNSPWGWPVAESLHFIGLSLLLGTVGLFDLRMLGFVKDLPLAALHKLVPFGVLGYLLNVSTGIMFFTTAPDQYMYNPAFQSKMMFMAVAGINMILFYQMCFRKVCMPEPALGSVRKARIFAGLSLLCWFGVIVGGRLITFYRPPFFWCVWCS